MRRPGLIVLLFVCLLCVGGRLPAYAQLISPGKLTAAHTSLEGLTNCTQCHSLGNRSADNTLCLDCHEPLANRIEADEGYHFNVADQNCAKCHKDHFGVEFIPVRLDTLTFEHEETGFELTGAHTETSCRGCHQPDYIVDEDVIAFKGEHDALEKTLLGIATQCIGCHLPESPHQNQFEGVDCAACHKTEIWEEAPLFDHDDANYALTGKHVDVSCDGCHMTGESLAGESFVQYTDLEFGSCKSCHDDVHEGSFGNNCSSCHVTQEWLEISGLDESAFDHSTTGFDLVGSHRTLECNSCHGKPARNDEEISLAFIWSTRNYTYPEVRVDNCGSCHVDYHEGEFVDNSDDLSCEGCHGQDEWYPSSFDLERHASESTFELTGAHVITPCSSCHRPDFDKKPHFEITDDTCIDCHKEDSPHGDQFLVDGNETIDGNEMIDGNETICESCHITDDWLTIPQFDHDETEFPLTGRHVSAECSSCHVSEFPDMDPPSPAVFRGTSETCESCHVEDDPHQGQFESEICDACHNTSSFLIEIFNHDDTNFPLTGEHIEVSCKSCHLEETGSDQTPFIRFKPLDVECQDCHSEE